jgi:hypothetical protein
VAPSAGGGEEPEVNLMTQPGTLIENAYVVPDLDAALDVWIGAGNAGPFFLVEHALPATGCTHRGRPTPLHTRVAFGVSGTMTIELVQQMNDAPSVFTEMLEGRGAGLHHLKYATPSRSAEVERLKRLGFDEVATLSSAGPERMISFIDTRAAMGAFMEVMDYAMWRPSHQALLAAHQGWDGRTDPLRPWSRLAEHFS